jgi:hypothetical protein
MHLAPGDQEPGTWRPGTWHLETRNLAPGTRETGFYGLLYPDGKVTGESYMRKLRTKVTEQEAFRSPWDGTKVTGVILYVRSLKNPPGAIRRAYRYGLGTTGTPDDGNGKVGGPNG